MKSDAQFGSTPPGGEVLLYEAPDGQVRMDVRLERETVWLSLTQMAELFGRDKSVISRHLRTVFAIGNWNERQLLQKMQLFKKGVVGRWQDALSEET